MNEGTRGDEVVMADPLVPIMFVLDRLKRSIACPPGKFRTLASFSVSFGGGETIDAPADGAVACPPSVDLTSQVRLTLRPVDGPARQADCLLSRLRDVSPAVLRVSRLSIDPVRDAISVSGWTNAVHPKMAILLYCNGHQISDARLLLKRPDVEANNSFIAPNCGWSIDVALPPAVGLDPTKAVFEVRLAFGDRVADVRPLAAPEGPADPLVIQKQTLRRALARKVVDAPRGRLEWLLASRAFQRRWVTSRESAAWYAREVIVDEMIRRLKSGDEIAVRLTNGDLVLCQPVDDSILARRFLIEGEDEHGFLEWIEAQVGEGDTAIDVGAAYGMVSRALARRGARVLAVEADPISAGRVRRSGLVFGKGRIDLVEAAVSDREEDVWFAGMGGSTAGLGKIIESNSADTVQGFLTEISSLNQVPLSTLSSKAKERRAFDDSDVNIRRCRGVTIDGLCREHGLRNVAIMKIDIEGGELLAFRGASGLLDGEFGTPPIVAFEYSNLFPTRGGDRSEILDIFLSRNWSLFQFSAGKGGGGELKLIPDPSLAPDHDNVIAIPPGRL